MHPLLRPVIVVALLLVPTQVGAEEPDDRPLLDTAYQALHLVGSIADHTARPWIRDRVVRDNDVARYGLKLDKDWEAVAAAAPQSPVVILLHGFNSTPLRNAGVMAPIRNAGFASGAFVYPNDWALDDSAALLSQQLKAFAQAHPGVQIALVTHSMGGLVARACVEDPKLDPGNVARLVMIAPPTHGSLIARLSVGADLWEHWIARRDGDFKTRWRDGVVDGLGEAADDLTPGSPFLTRLNARDRNPRIRYAIFLGTHAPVTARESEFARRTLYKSLRRVEWLGGHADEVDAMLAELDEVIEGKGDGVVAVERGRLEGVDDVVVLPFDHLSCTDEPKDDAVRQVQTELLARLR